MKLLCKNSIKGFTTGRTYTLFPSNDGMYVINDNGANILADTLKITKNTRIDNI